MRHACLVFWGVALYYKGYPPGINAVWITYACGVLYTIVLHWLLRVQADASRTTAMLGTLADSLLTFFICYVTGGLSSIFVPFFYLTVLSEAFRCRRTYDAVARYSILEGPDWLAASPVGLRH